MLLYVKEVLPVLKSCIWVCGGTRDGLSAGGNRIQTLSPSASESVFSRYAPSYLDEFEFGCDFLHDLRYGGKQDGNSRRWQAAIAAR